MSTEKWVSANVDFILNDDTWVHFEKGIYDSRDEMSDVVRPIWDNSGEYRVLIIPAEDRVSFNAKFIAYTDKNWANKIYFNLKRELFSSAEDLKKAFRYEGKKANTYEKCYNIVEEIVKLTT